MKIFQNWQKDINLQIQEAEWTPNRINLKKLMPKYIIIKLLKYKDKEKILKAAREKQHLTYRKKTIRMTVDFSSETMEVRRMRHTFFQVLKKKELSTQNSIPSENILQEWKENQDILRWRKTKRICHLQTYPKRMAKEGPPNRKL